MYAALARIMILVALIATVSGCAAYDRITKGPSCYDGEQAPTSRCHDDRVPGSANSAWWRTAHVQVNGESVYYTITNVDSAVWLPAEPISMLNGSYAHSGIQKVVRYNNIDIVQVWVSKTCEGELFEHFDVFAQSCGALFLDDSEYVQMAPYLAEQLLSKETLEQLQLRASVTGRDIVYALGIVDDE